MNSAKYEIRDVFLHRAEVILCHHHHHQRSIDREEEEVEEGNLFTFRQPLLMKEASNSTLTLIPIPYVYIPLNKPPHLIFIYFFVYKTTTDSNLRNYQHNE